MRKLLGFGAVAAFESSWLKGKGGDPKQLNMSEQHVLNCTSGSSCAGGWHYDALTLLKERGDDKEADEPYAGSDQPCQPGSNLPYQAVDLGFVDKANTIPTPEQIKTALMQHGAVVVAMLATDAFLAAEFTEWWAVYPHKIGKAAAAKKFEKARKSGIGQSALLAGVRRYIATKPAGPSLVQSGHLAQPGPLGRPARRVGRLKRA